MKQKQKQNLANVIQTTTEWRLQLFHKVCDDPAIKELRNSLLRTKGKSSRFLTAAFSRLLIYKCGE